MTLPALHVLAEGGFDRWRRAQLPKARSRAVRSRPALWRIRRWALLLARGSARPCRCSGWLRRSRRPCDQLRLGQGFGLGFASAVCLGRRWRRCRGRGSPSCSEPDPPPPLTRTTTTTTAASSAAPPPIRAQRRGLRRLVGRGGRRLFGRGGGLARSMVEARVSPAGVAIVSAVRVAAAPVATVRSGSATAARRCSAASAARPRSPAEG